MTLAIFHGEECPYCGRTIMHGHPELAPTRDHVLPRSKGGSAILIVCWRCNNDKGDTMPDVYLGRLRGERRTIARLAMIDALRQAIDCPESVQELPAPRGGRRGVYARLNSFSTTVMQEAFAKAGQKCGLM